MLKATSTYIAITKMQQKQSPIFKYVKTLSGGRRRLVKELKPVKYGLYRIIIAATCFILVILLQFFEEFAEFTQCLQQKIEDNSGPIWLEQQLYEFIESIKD